MFHKNLVFYLFFFFLIHNAFGFDTKKPKSLVANRIQEKPMIDGKIEENLWFNQAKFYSGQFTQIEPNNGELSEQQTEIRIVYNDQSIYIAARMFDTQADSILKQFGPRDSRGQNSDYFGISIDTYNKQQNAFNFVVSVAGVQSDSYITPNGDDRNWNVIWKSAVKIHDKGWDVEMEIPYSSIRFPNQDEQVWGINFMRELRRRREVSHWNPVDAAVNGFVNQFGTLVGIKGIKPPIRLFFIPYATAYVVEDQVANESGTSLTGGMDIKYGINESFTLDMSLIPDFGQVRSDNIVLNLSPFEVFFTENRPFFTEGTELFDRNGLFYSRRVGQSFGIVELNENEEIVEGVTEAPLINASKISGRTNKGLGIGFFNAVTNQTEARIRNIESGEEREAVVDPITNFNVVVLEQNLKNNSNIAFINTNVTRFGSYDANVTGLDFRLNDKSNTYRIEGFGAVNQLYDRGEGLANDVGYKYTLNLAKVSGRLQYGMSRNVETENYNPNDMGFLRNANTIGHSAYFTYNQFQPKGKILRFSYTLRAWHNQLFKPQTFTNTGIEQRFWLRFRNFLTVGGNTTYNPTNSYDYFEPRVAVRYFRKASWYRTSFWLSTDYRKVFALDINAGFWERREFNQFDNWFGFSPRVRISDKVSIWHNFDISWRRRELGYVNRTYDDSDNLQDIIFGQRIVHNITNTFNASIAFNPLMDISLRVRHYWSNVLYTSYRKLSEDGEVLNTDYTGLNEDGSSRHNTNFNAFNVDMFYTWQFAPGSQMVVAWKNAIQTSNDITELNFNDNFRQVIQAPQNNSFSIRVLYFLDYLYLKKRN